ncbi:unnamed protein product, partial [Meganyctiphanes norvegica]
ERPTYSYSPPQNTYQAPEYSSEESYSASSEEEYGYGPAKYDFDWSVKDEYSGNNFGQEESREGDRTEGSYYVHLPDGRLQKVTYYVDGDSGYVAEVTYEGEAQYHEASEESSESYEAPRSRYSAPESEESYEVVVPAGRYGAPRN